MKFAIIFTITKPAITYMDNAYNDLNEEEQRLENELKKIKLSLEHGMDLSKSFSSPDLSPKVEGQFLDYMQEWETQFAAHKMTTVYEMAERPQFRNPEDVTDEEIGDELDRLMEHLHAHSIILETLCDVDERVLYSFVTKQFLKEELQDIRIEGMMHHFIYEDFCPNHPYDIKNRCVEFVEYLANGKADDTFLPLGMEDVMSAGGVQYTKQEIDKHIIRFRGLFISLSLETVEHISIEVSNEDTEATAVVFLKYAGVTESNEAIELAGNCTFRLERMYDW